MPLDHLPTVRPVGREDLPAIRTILEGWLIDPQSRDPLNEEIDHRMATVEGTLVGHPSRQFVVAVDDGGRVLGVAGLQSDNISAELFGAGERAVEVVTAYVRFELKGMGVGQTLLDVLEEAALAAGFTTLLVVSGSRHRESGYPFWRRQYGEPVRHDNDFFGPGQERVVWRRAL